MKLRLIYSICLLVLTSAPILAQRQQRHIPFSVVIRAPESEIKSGSEVVVDITITNTSDAAIGLEEMEISPYVAIVREANGLLAPETELGKKLKQKQRERIDPNWAGSRIGSSLQPGESVHAKCVVSERYDMNAPGRYSIQVERLWGRSAVPSNTINVSVIP